MTDLPKRLRHAAAASGLRARHGRLLEEAAAALEGRQAIIDECVTALTSCVARLDPRDQARITAIELLRALGHLE